MNHIKEMADLEQRIEDAFKGDLDKANHKSRQELAAARDAKRDRKGRIEFRSAGAIRLR